MTRDTRVSALLWRCTLLAIVAALPVAFNWWIDPARLRGWPAEERAIANALLAGYNVTDVANYNDRTIERLLALARTRGPDVLAIGSSRSQPLPAAAFPGRTYVNASISGARLDEILGVYALYDTVRRRPRRLVLNLDPWTLQVDADGPNWGSLLEEHDALMRRLGEPTSLWRDWVSTNVATFKRIASPEYFRLALFSLSKYGQHGIRYVVTDRVQNKEKTKMPDGTLVWSLNPPEKTERLVRDYLVLLRAGRAPYRGFETLDPARTELLERFIRYIRGQGVAVDILLVPFHPDIFAEFAKRPLNPLTVTQNRYRDIARRTGAAVIGTYDPSAAGFSREDLFDESHVRPEALVRLFRR